MTSTKAARRASGRRNGCTTKPRAPGPVPSAPRSRPPHAPEPPPAWPCPRAAGEPAPSPSRPAALASEKGRSPTARLSLRCRPTPPRLSSLPPIGICARATYILHTARGVPSRCAGKRRRGGRFSLPGPFRHVRADFWISCGSPAGEKRLTRLGWLWRESYGGSGRGSALRPAGCRRRRHLRSRQSRRAACRAPRSPPRQGQAALRT